MWAWQKCGLRAHNGRKGGAREQRGCSIIFFVFSSSSIYHTVIKSGMRWKKGQMLRSRFSQKSPRTSPSSRALSQEVTDTCQCLCFHPPISIGILEYRIKKKKNVNFHLGVYLLLFCGLDINGYVLSYFEGAVNLHCYTSCTLTTLQCSKV